MSPGWRTAALLAGLGALAAGAAPGCRRPAGRTGSGAPGQRLGPFRLGEQVRSHAHLQLRLELSGSSSTQELEISGDWAATPTDLDGELVQVACALAHPSVRIPAGVSSAERARAEQDVAQALGATPFFVTHRRDGAAVGLWFPRGTNPAIANLLITLAGAQQLVHGDQPGPAWVTTERDANGQYLAAYRQEGAGRYTKMKARYLDTIQPPGGAPRAFAGPMSGPPRTFMRVERSEHELRADGGGRLLEVRGSEVLVLQIGGPGVALKTTVALELGGGRLADASTLVGAFTRQRAGLVAQPMEQMALDARAERARRDRVLLAGAGLPELLGAWAALPSDPPPSSREAGDLTARFEALFRTDAAAAAQVPALVRHFSVERGKLLVDALSLSASPASQRALGQVAIDAAAPPSARSQALQYLAQQPEPPPEAVAAVAALLDDADPRFRQLARSTYGACARSLRSSEPVRARRIVDDLQARLGRAGAGEQRDFLNALGNAGDPASLPLLRRLIEQAERHLRPEAVAALRGIDHPEVDPLLVDLLRAPEPAVRLAAIRAIRARAIGPFAAALVEVARQDASEVVRNGATTLLRDRASQLPTLRPVVQALAGRGVSAETRPPELPPR